MSKASDQEIAALEAVDTDAVEAPLLDTLLGYALRRAQLRVFQQFISSLEPHDIRPAQFSALVLVERYPGITQSSLARTLGIDAPGMVNLIHKLEGRGLALRVRCKRDRRSHGIFLSKQGEALVQELKPLAVASDEAAASRLSAGEREQLLALLRKIYR